jgi:hypothetical protein
MDDTPRLGMPLLAAGQAQKELLHNEALAILDILVGAAVEGPPDTAPPGNPVPGASFIVAKAATGEWSGRDGCLASFAEGGWRYVHPWEGLRVHVASLGQDAVFREGRWDFGSVRCARLEVGGRAILGQPPTGVARPAGGRTVDSEARKAIDDLLSALGAQGLLKT